MTEPDNLRIQRNDDGDYVLTRDGHEGSLTIAPEHIITLSQSLPELASQLLQARHGPGSPEARPMAHMELKRAEVQSDRLGSVVLLRLTDTQGIEYSFGSPPRGALQLGQKLVEVASQALSLKRPPRQ